MKKSISLFLAFIFMVSISGIAIAEDDHGIVRHTITFSIPPKVTAFIIPGGDSPDIWGQGNFNLETGAVFYSADIIIPERYFAYEMTATGASSGLYTVKLLWHGLTEIASGTTYANGVMNKIDWINVTPGDTYCFKTINNSGYTLSITITYYSWA